jgi:hypothetical protein
MYHFTCKKVHVQKSTVTKAIPRIKEDIELVHIMNKQYLQVIPKEKLLA